MRPSNRSAGTWSSPPSSGSRSTRTARRPASPAGRTTSVRRSRARCVVCGPTPSTCSTSTASTRTSPSRTSPAPSRRAHRGGQGPPLRDVRGRGRHDPPGPRGPAGHGVAERVLPVLAGARGRDPARPGGSASASCRSARSGSGFLTGTGRPLEPHFGEGDIRDHDPPALRARRPAAADLRPRRARHRRVAEAQCAPPSGQVALAWLLAQQPWVVPIPGTRRLERLDENLGSAALDLTPEDLAELDEASSERAGPGRPLPGGHAADDRPLTPRPTQVRSPGRRRVRRRRGRRRAAATPARAAAIAPRARPPAPTR